MVLPHLREAVDAVHVSDMKLIFLKIEEEIVMQFIGLFKALHYTSLKHNLQVKITFSPTK